MAVSGTFALVSVLVPGSEMVGSVRKREHENKTEKKTVFELCAHISRAFHLRVII